MQVKNFTSNEKPLPMQKSPGSQLHEHFFCLKNPPENHSLISNRKRLAWLRLKIKLDATLAFLQFIKNPLKTLHTAKRLRIFSSTSKNVLQKLVKVDGRYFTEMDVPSWPSAAYLQYLANELKQLTSATTKIDLLQTVQISIIMKCVPVLENSTYNTSLSDQQALGLDKLKTLIHKYQQQGVVQFLLSGGEPMERYNDMVELLRSSQKASDFWLITSGYQLSLEKARELKQAGLTGVAITLDHFDPEKHNDLHSYKHSYGWVLKAVESVRKAKLVLCLRLCPTPDFLNANNLFLYARLARKLGVSFIQIVDPCQYDGHRGNKRRFSQEQLVALEDFTQTINYDPDFMDWPVVSYPSSMQLRQQTSGKYDKGTLVITADGKIQMN